MSLVSYPLYIWDTATEQWLLVGGPPGPQGPVGPAGPAGPTGPGGAGVPAGSFGDMLWHDGSAWVVLPAPTEIADVITAFDSGEGLYPLWAPLPPAPGPTVQEVMCGIARFLADKMSTAYGFVHAHLTQQYIHQVAGLGTLETFLLTLIAVIFPEFGIPFGVFVGLLNGYITADDTASVVGILAPLTPGQEEELAQAWYCALVADSNAVTITPAVLTNLHANIAAYSYWASADQAAILSAIVDAYSGGQWATWAAAGALDPLGSCAGFGCGE